MTLSTPRVFRRADTVDALSLYESYEIQYLAKLVDLRIATSDNEDISLEVIFGTEVLSRRFE